jgi:molybdopterin converting factor subunit 1
MNLNVRLFATLTDIIGTSQITLDLSEGATVIDLLNVIAEKYPGVDPFLKSLLVAVNHEYAGLTAIIHHSDEIALFPPVSGG